MFESFCHSEEAGGPEVRSSGQIRKEPLSLLFAALGGVVLLFIIAPLLGLFVRCSLPELVDTAKETEFL